jgi:peptide/nickel transport system permease protein
VTTVDMNAASARIAASTPMAARAGMVLPGLGHLLSGEVLTGVGLLIVDAELIWAAVAGFPRIDAVLFWGPLHQPGIHGFIALISWFVVAGIAYRAAYRFAFPALVSDADWNSNRAIFVRQFSRNRTGMIGMFGAITMIVITLLTPMIAPFDPDTVDAGVKQTAPGWQLHDGVHTLYLMGTDQYGRDLLSRVLYGGRISLLIGFIAMGLASTIGVSVGAVAGYAGGWLDRVLMWFVDLLLSLPKLVLLLAIVGLFRVSGVESIFLIVTILGLTGWMSVSRIVRGQVLSLKEQDFVQAARAIGMSPARIVFRHLIPNALAPVIVYSALEIGSTILAEASLSFLGLGVSPPTSTWGTLVNDGREPLRTAPWIFLFPGLFIVLAVMSFSLVGDGLRDTLDPKLRGR